MERALPPDPLFSEKAEAIVKLATERLAQTSPDKGHLAKRYAVAAILEAAMDNAGKDAPGVLMTYVRSSITNDGAFWPIREEIRQKTKRNQTLFFLLGILLGITVHSLVIKQIGG